MEIIKSPAKLNLYLHIIDKIRTGKYNGYHEIDSLIYFDNNFYDEIYYKEAEATSCEIIGKQADLIDPKNNLITNAIQLIKNISGCTNNIKIILKKNIPIGAGLGGGSSNAATIIQLLNKIWKLNISLDDLIKLSLGLGADVPVCIFGKSARISGIGEIIEPVDLSFNLDIKYKYLYKSLMTKDVYKNLQITNRKTKLLLPKFSSKEELINFLNNNTSNDIQKSAIKIMPEIQNSLNYLKSHYDSQIIRMTGSGNACFAIM